MADDWRLVLAIFPGLTLVVLGVLFLGTWAIVLGGCIVLAMVGARPHWW